MVKPPKKPTRSSVDPIDLLIDDHQEPMISKKGGQTPATDLEAVYHAHIRKIEAAIKERDKEELSDIIVKVKTVGQLDESYKAPDSIMKTKMKLLGVIKRGEEALIRFSMKQ